MATITTTAASARKPLYSSLFVQVLTALLLGVVLGMATPDFAVSLKILSDAFLKLISMIVAPIVFCVVVHGIAGAGDLKKVGRVGVKALVYFEVMTTIALVVGLFLPVREMVRLHPYQYTHFNVLAGGIRAADDRYMLDYWGLSFKQAAQELRARLTEGLQTPTDGRRWRVAICGPMRTAQVELGPEFRITSDTVSTGIPDAARWDMIVVKSATEHSVSAPGVVVTTLWNTRMSHARPVFAASMLALTWEAVRPPENDEIDPRERSLCGCGGGNVSC